MPVSHVCQRAGWGNQGSAPGPDLAGGCLLRGKVGQEATALCSCTSTTPWNMPDPRSRVPDATSQGHGSEGARLGQVATESPTRPQSTLDKVPSPLCVPRVFSFNKGTGAIGTEACGNRQPGPAWPPHGDICRTRLGVPAQRPTRGPQSSSGPARGTRPPLVRAGCAWKLTGAVPARGRCWGSVHWRMPSAPPRNGTCESAPVSLVLVPQCARTVPFREVAPWPPRPDAA